MPIDEDTIKVIYENKDKLVNRIIKYGIPEYVANDLFQDAIIKIRESNTEINNVLGYFSRMLSHMGTNYHRDNKYVYMNDNINELVEEKAEPTIDDDKVNELLSDMSNEERLIVTEHIYNNKTFSEIAEQHKLNESTVKGKYFRMIKRFEVKYKQKGVSYFYE